MKKIIRLLIISLLLTAAVPTLSYAESGNEILESFDKNTPSDDEIDENYEAAGKQLDEIYYNALDRLSNDEGPMNVPFGKWLYIRFYRLYYALKDAAPYICSISFFLGVLLMAVSQQNKRIQKKALVYLVILIPLATVFIVFAVGATPLFKAK